VAALGPERGISAVRRLSGGYVADAWLITHADGTRVVGKTLADAPADLLMEALAPRGDSQRSWDTFAHDLAALHRGTVHDRFGWASDGYLGRLVQHNPWTVSGHEFFAQHRVLRYLNEPLVQRLLTRADRQARRHAASSISTRNSAPHRRTGSSVCRCSTFASC
jgi:fructosamine-3-kinase